MCLFVTYFNSLNSVISFFAFRRMRTQSKINWKGRQPLPNCYRLWLKFPSFRERKIKQNLFSLWAHFPLAIHKQDYVDIYWMLNFHNKVVREASPFLLFLHRAVNMLMFGGSDLLTSSCLIINQELSFMDTGDEYTTSLRCLPDPYSYPLFSKRTTLEGYFIFSSATPVCLHSNFTFFNFC